MSESQICRPAPSHTLSYSTKSDTHEIIMNPSDRWGTYSLMKYFCPHKNSEKKMSYSPHIIPKTKGLEASLQTEWVANIKYSIHEGIVIKVGSQVCNDESSVCFRKKS